MSTQLEVGAEVRIIDEKHKFHGECGVVLEVSKGWWSVDLNDTDEETIVKVRQSALELWVEETDELKGMSNTLNKYRKTYKATHTAKGNKSQSSKLSVVAELMEGYDHAYVAQIAASMLGLTKADKKKGIEEDEQSLWLYHAYSPLNNGQMRMNAGNRINAAIKRGDITREDVKHAMENDSWVVSADELDPKYRPERVSE